MRLPPRLVALTLALAFLASCGNPKPTGTRIHGAGVASPSPTPGAIAGASDPTEGLAKGVSGGSRPQGGSSGSDLSNPAGGLPQGRGGGQDPSASVAALSQGATANDLLVALAGAQASTFTARYTLRPSLGVSSLTVSGRDGDQVVAADSIVDREALAFYRQMATTALCDRPRGGTWSCRNPTAARPEGHVYLSDLAVNPVTLLSVAVAKVSSPGAQLTRRWATTIAGVAVNCAAWSAREGTSGIVAVDVCVNYSGVPLLLSLPQYGSLTAQSFSAGVDPAAFTVPAPVR